MDDDPTFQYVKLFVENVSLWPFVLMGLVAFLLLNKTAFSRLSENIEKIKVGSVEVVLRELKEKIEATHARVEETTQQVQALENEVERDRIALTDLLESFDPHAPVAELARTRDALRAMAPSLDDLEPVHKGLAEGASAEEVYAAAEIARTRRDVALFDELVACLDRLAADPDLGGIRLHTVWTLTSALHRTAIAAIKHTEMPLLSREQLLTARAMLDRLVRNPRVEADRPETPTGGVKGPAGWARDWIDKGLAKLDQAGGQS